MHFRYLLYLRDDTQILLSFEKHDTQDSIDDTALAPSLDLILLMHQQLLRLFAIHLEYIAAIPWSISLDDKCRLSAVNEANGSDVERVSACHEC